MPPDMLNYVTASSDQHTAFWKTTSLCTAIVPFVILPVFVLGTAILQDDLINGDGHSWQRAAHWIAIPTGIFVTASLLVAINAFVRVPRTRRLSAFGMVMNALALALIVLLVRIA